MLLGICNHSFCFITTFVVFHYNLPSLLQSVLWNQTFPWCYQTICSQLLMIDQSDVSNYNFWLHIFPAASYWSFFLSTLAYCAFGKTYFLNFFFFSLPHPDVPTKTNKGKWILGEIKLFILLTAFWVLYHKKSWITYTVCAAERDYTLGFLYCTLNMVRVYSYYKYIFIKINHTKTVSSSTSWILLREIFSMQFAFAYENIQTVHFWQKVNSRCSSMKLILGKFIWKQISDAWWMTSLCLCDDWQEKDGKWISGRNKMKVADI